MPINKVKKIIGMDGYSDSTTLPEGVMRSIENLFPDNGGLRTREGNVKDNSIELTGSSGVFGLGEIYSSAGTRRTLAVSNGKLYSGSAGTYSEEATGLNATNPCQVLPFQDKALINDQVSGLYVMSQAGGDSVALAGLPSPKTTKLISSFESDTEFFLTNGTQALNYAQFIHGTSSLTFTSASGSVCNADATPAVALVLGTSATFDDGSASTNDDYISVFLIPDNPSSFSSCSLYFGDVTNYFSTNLLISKAWVENTTPSSGITIRVRKSEFIATGSPDWNSIAEWGFNFGSAGVVTLTCDYIRLEKSGPLVYEQNKIISRIEQNEAGMTYSYPGGTSWTPQYTAREEGGLALQTTAGSGTIGLSTVAGWDLTLFDNGSSAAATDDIKIYAGKSKTAGNPTIQLRFYTDGTGSNYWESAVTPINAVDTLAAINISKADFTATGTASVWSAIHDIGIILASNSGTVYIDELSLVKHKDALIVNEFDSTETWVGNSGVTQTWNTNDLNKLRGDEGSSASLGIRFTKNGTNGGIGTLLQNGLTLDLSLFSTNVAVLSTDTLGLWMFLQNYNTVKEVTLEVGDAAFATYKAAITFTQDEIKANVEGTLTSQMRLTGAWYNLRKEISSWVTTGSMDWTAVTDLKVTFTLADRQSACSFWLDRWTIERAETLSGIYSYKVVYVTADGERSDASLPSDELSLSGAIAYLTRLPIPGGSKIAYRELYRLGGTSDQWQLVAIISDITTTTFLDELADESLGVPLVEVEGQPMVPKAVAVCNNQVVLGNLVQDETIYYPCGIQVSNLNSCDVYPVEKFFEIESGRNQIKWLYWIFGKCFVGKETSIWKFDPKDLTKEPEKLTDAYGGVGCLAVDGGEEELYFLDINGVVCYNNSYFDVISDATEKHPSSIRNYIDLIPSGYLDRCWIKYYDGMVIVGLVQTAGTYPTKILVWHVKEKMWTEITSANNSWNVRCASSYKNSTDGNVLLLGQATAGFVYKGLDDSSDVDVSTAGVSNRIASVLWTGDRDFDEPQQGKDYEKLWLFGKKLTSTSATVVATVYGDCSAFVTTLTEDFEASTLSIDSLTHKKFEIPGIQLQYFQTYLGLKLSVTDRWQFRSLVEKIRYEGAM